MLYLCARVGEGVAETVERALVFLHAHNAVVPFAHRGGDGEVARLVLIVEVVPVVVGHLDIKHQMGLGTAFEHLCLDADVDVQLFLAHIAK